MTTTLNLPDDLASAVQRRAAQGGRDVAAELVELVRKGLEVSEGTAEVIIGPKRNGDTATVGGADPALAPARARMQELFGRVKGFRMSLKIRREDLYDRHGLR